MVKRKAPGCAAVGSLFTGLFGSGPASHVPIPETVTSAPNSVLTRRAELRESIWLWLDLFLRAKVTADQRWWPVEGAFTDEDLASALAASAGSLRAWRRRLERLGLIRTFRAGRRQRRFELLNIYAPPAVIAGEDQAQTTSFVN
jgi:hypothetical protein